MKRGFWGTEGEGRVICMWKKCESLEARRRTKEGGF